MRLTQEQLDQYDEDGYVIVPDFLSAQEVGFLAADADILGTPRRGLPEGNVYEKNSGLIRKSYSFDKDFESYHVLTRLPRMLAPARQILGEDIYLYMTHMNHKIAEKGERWLWHLLMNQDPVNLDQGVGDDALLEHARRKGLAA